MTDVAPAGNGLTPAELRHLHMLERRIERGLNTFREVGAALLEIRDKRLWRVSHSSFEAYVAEKWGLERARAYQLIGAAEVVEVLGPAGDVIQNEAQARELVSLAHSDPGKLPEVIESIEGPMTAPALRRAVQEVTGSPPTTQANGVVQRAVGADRLLGRIEALNEPIERFLEADPPPEDRKRVAAALRALAKRVT